MKVGSYKDTRGGKHSQKNKPKPGSVLELDRRKRISRRRRGGTEKKELGGGGDNSGQGQDCWNGGGGSTNLSINTASGNTAKICREKKHPDKTAEKVYIGNWWPYPVDSKSHTVGWFNTPIQREQTNGKKATLGGFRGGTPPSPQRGWRGGRAWLGSATEIRKTRRDFPAESLIRARPLSNWLAGARSQGTSKKGNLSK